MAGTVNQRLQAHASANVESPNALRSVKFVAGRRQQIHAELINVRRNLTDRLRRVSVKQNAVLAGDPGNVGDRLNGSNLVVSVYDGDQDRAGSDGASYVVRLDTPEAVHANVRHRSAHTLQKTTRIDDGRVFHLGGDDVSVIRSLGEKHALEGVIVGLASAAGEHNLKWCAAQQVSDLAACGLHSLLRRSPSPMLTRGIAECVLQHLIIHSRGHFRCNRRAGIEIKINAFSVHRVPLRRHTLCQNINTESLSFVQRARFSMWPISAPSIRSCRPSPLALQQLSQVLTFTPLAMSSLSISAT